MLCWLCCEDDVIVTHAGHDDIPRCDFSGPHDVGPAPTSFQASVSALSTIAISDLAQA